MIVYSDLAFILFLILFLPVFKLLTKKETIEALKNHELTSDYSIRVEGLPVTKDITAEEVEMFFEQYYGIVSEVAFARKFKSIMKAFQAQDTLNKKIRHEEVLT